MIYLLLTNPGSTDRTAFAGIVVEAWAMAKRAWVVALLAAAMGNTHFARADGEYKDIKSLAVVIEAKYPGSLDKAWSLVQSWCALAKVRCVPDGSSGQQAVMNVNIDITPLSAVYAEIGKSYTGVLINGNIELRAPGHPNFLERIEARREPAAVAILRFGARGPNDVPLSPLFLEHGSVAERIGFVFGRAFGPAVLGRALADRQADGSVLVGAVFGLIKLGDSSVDILLALAKNSAISRYLAIWCLGQRNEARAMPILIDALADTRQLSSWVVSVPPHKTVRDFALEALVRITGENFGDSPTQWRKWWLQKSKW